MSLDDPARTDGSLLAEVLARIADEDEVENREAFEAFAKAYLRRMPPRADGSDPDSVFHEVRALFEFVSVRQGEPLVRVFNPTEESDGYQTVGSVVEVNVEDSPFLLDSISNELHSRDLGVTSVLHPVIGVERDSQGRLHSVRHARHTLNRESVQHYELDTRLPETERMSLERVLPRVIDDVQRVVGDFHAMVGRVDRMVDLVRVAAGFVDAEEIAEAVAFLEWLTDDNFVFLGYREYRMFETPEGEEAVQLVPGSGLGILRAEERSQAHEPLLLSGLPADTAARYRGRDLLVITKTNRESTVHRRSKMDYVGVRMFGPDGRTVGEARLLGLFTSRAYMEPASQVPILRQKLQEIVEAEDLIDGSHDHKAVVQLFEGFSKHDLFTAPTPALRRDLMSLLALQEQQHVRLMVRRDLLQRSVSILVALPRDRFNAALRKSLQQMFLERFNGTSVEYHLALGDADPAQMHFTVWVEWGSIPEIDIESLEEEVYRLTRSWRDQVLEALARRNGHARARSLVDAWCDMFPDYYQAGTAMPVVAGDIESLDRLATSDSPFVVGIQNEAGAGEGLTRIALYRRGGKRPLTELMPALENLGLQVVEEVPTRLEGEDDYFIHDFGVLGSDGTVLDVEETGERIRSTLEAVWSGAFETDRLHRLVITGGLSHQQVEILTAYRTYWRRVRPVFTVAYVDETLTEFPDLAADLVRLFEMRFDPDRAGAGAAALEQSITERLDAVPSLDQDRILRAFLRMIEATVRTNAYLSHREALAFKLRSADVPDVPDPRPYAEIFVIGPSVEGVHLRGGPIARGGIRWSTRREDYRTEVLGLMKAQMTKNAVIVPTGAKGGFVLRRPPSDPAELRSEVARQYEVFIRALLDLTDNLEDGDPVHPKGVIVHDGADPYLVVAADKGTATFSDVANRIAGDYGFWLDDAFASGGSTGYDHKALGITARGAWVSLRRHFFEIGIDPDVDEFTVVGIGDMSGDVFGNGMLLSERIRLIAAFDHRHVFVDPDPDSTASFAERQRLFGLPGSSWADYDRSVISTGGGVWPRSAKRIELSEPARQALGTDQAVVTPDQLISIILRAPVDLLWNGGIGTYVKASEEAHEEAGDRSNDPVRVDAPELRCRVVVEGGNLGFTQAARIQFARRGGRVNTDFIDNSAGVDCSDREVNLKILLGVAERDGLIDRDERNRIIGSVADEVVEKILYDNFQQAQILSQEEVAATRRMEEYEHLIGTLSAGGILDRELEGLPSGEELSDLAQRGQGLTRPELAVLLVDAKRSIQEDIERSHLPDDPHLDADLRSYFPPPVVERFGELLPRHPLRRTLVSMVLANDVVNSLGAVFVTRLCRQTGAEPADVVRAYRVAREVSSAIAHWESIEAILGEIDYEVWLSLMERADRLMASLTRWYMAHEGGDTMGTAVAFGAPGFRSVLDALPDCGPPAWRERVMGEVDALREAGVPEQIAMRDAVSGALLFAPDAIQLAEARSRRPVEVLSITLHLVQAVGLDRLLAGARAVRPRDPWERWALQTLQDDLVAVGRRMTLAAIEEAGDRPAEDVVDHFLAERSGSVARLVRFLRTIGDRPEGEIASLVVASRQIDALIE